LYISPHDAYVMYHGSNVLFKIFEEGYIFLFLFFFFSSRRRHTRSKRDWSSDVCSSDLHFMAAHSDQPGERFPAVVLVFDKKNIHHAISASVRPLGLAPKFDEPQHPSIPKQQISCQIRPRGGCSPAFSPPIFGGAVAPPVLPR